MYVPMKVDVSSVGENVVVAIGSWRGELFFETAILLASWLELCARAAKRWSGNGKLKLRGIGTLHDASKKDWLNDGQPFDPNRVFPVARALLKKERVEVRSEMTMVVLIAAGVEMSMPYEAALQIGQWIRVRAKESQLRAGDATRHWSEITKAHDEQVGPNVTRG